MDGCIFSGAIWVNANNITISNSIVNAPLAANYAISSNGSTRTGTILRNVKVSGATGKCIYIIGGFTGERLNVHGCEDAVFGDNWTLRDSYVHDLLTGGGRHSDGAQVPNVGNIVVTGNNIVVATGVANSALFFQSNFGLVNNVLVQDNLLGGGTYTVYCDQKLSHPLPTNVRFIDNVFVRSSASFGPGFVPCKTAAGFVWSGNVYDDGAALPVP